MIINCKLMCVYHYWDLHSLRFLLFLMKFLLLFCTCIHFLIFPVPLCFKTDIVTVDINFIHKNITIHCVLINWSMLTTFVPRMHIIDLSFIYWCKRSSVVTWSRTMTVVLALISSDKYMYINTDHQFTSQIICGCMVMCED